MRNLAKRAIIFLVRKRLGVETYELFRFCNQKSKNAVYYFNDEGLMKTWWSYGGWMYDKAIKSTASLNWLLDDDCKIDIFKEEQTK